MEFLLFVILGGSFWGAYKLTPKPAIKPEEDQDELLPW